MTSAPLHNSQACLKTKQNKRPRAMGNNKSLAVQKKKKAVAKATDTK